MFILLQIFISLLKVRQEDIEEFIDMYRNGVNIDDIANRYGIHRNYVYNLGRHLGVYREVRFAGTGKYRYTKMYVPEFGREYICYKSLAEEVGCSLMTICNYAKSGETLRINGYNIHINIIK